MVIASDNIYFNARSVADLIAFIEQDSEFAGDFDLRLHALSIRLNDGALAGVLSAAVKSFASGKSIRVRMSNSSMFRAKLSDGTQLAQCEVGYLQNASVERDGRIHLACSDRFPNGATIKNVEFVHAPFETEFAGIEHAIVTWAVQDLDFYEYCHPEIMPGVRRLDYSRLGNLQLAYPTKTVRFISAKLETVRRSNTFTDPMRDEWSKWIGAGGLETAIRRTLRKAGFKNIARRARHTSD